MMQFEVKHDIQRDIKIVGQDLVEYTVKKMLSQLKFLRQPASADFLSSLKLFLQKILNFMLYKLITTSWENSKICWSWLP